MIDLKSHYGFTRTPFGKDLAPSMLCRYPAHAEAVARITWCARERALGVITGEVGAGNSCAGLKAEELLFLVKERFELLETESGAKSGVVAELGMRVERQVRTVNRQITFCEQPKQFIIFPRPRLARTPK